MERKFSLSYTTFFMLSDAGRIIERIRSVPTAGVTAPSSIILQAFVRIVLYGLQSCINPSTRYCWSIDKHDLIIKKIIINCSNDLNIIKILSDGFLFYHNFTVTEVVRLKAISITSDNMDFSLR